MAKAAQANPDGNGAGGPVNGEYEKPDAAKAFEIYNKQIKPKLTHISTLTGDLSQPWDDIKEMTRMPRPVMNFIIMLLGLEDAKQDHFLLALQLGLQHCELGVVPTDLVSTADGSAGQPIIAAASRPRPKLVTVPDAAAGGPPASAGAFTEATKEELEQQEGRKQAETPDAGTGAAARAAMKKSAEEKPES